MDQPRDERSLDRQGCLLPTMLIVAAASRDFWIGRLECLHVDQTVGNETVPSARAVDPEVPTIGLQDRDNRLAGSVA
jgi:hypothetical protein